MDIVVPDTFQKLFEESEERPVVKVPAEVLRQVAAPVDRVHSQRRAFAERMVKVMKQAHGIGLAAPQLGLSERLIVIQPGDKAIALFNPVVTETEGEDLGEEGCLSIPGLYGDVVRAERLMVEGWDIKGRKVGYEMEGLAARIVLHEVDHLDGILFTDRAVPESLHWRMPDHELED
jgi:peptide deformylase